MYDISTGADDYPSDWQAIADWYESRTGADIICDARIISSYWNGRWGGEGQNLSANYFENLRNNPAGGLVLGTDQDVCHTGLNTLSGLIGLDPFVGVYTQTTIPVDTLHPLMTTPNDLGVELSDDSSPGRTPYGSQPGGQFLWSVAWHGDDPDAPGISTTIEGGTGFHVDIRSPDDATSVFWEESITFWAVPRNGEAPYAYEWTSDIDGVIGAGDTFDTDTLSGGEHTITVSAEDGAGRTDDDTIVVTVVGTPDLEVFELEWPGAGLTGQPFQLSWAITNTGITTAAGPWTDRVYISPDDVYGNGNDAQLWQGGFATGESLAPGAIHEEDGEYTLPGTPGEYWIIVATDTGNQVGEALGEDNNVTIADSPIVVDQFPTPDLEVVSLVTPVTAAGGDTIVVEYEVENVGTETATINWQDAIYLSSDEVLDGGDQRLRLNPIAEAPLAPGEFYGVSRTVMLPVSYVAGTAYIIVKTDDGGVLAELDEQNNVLASEYINVIPTPAPDLTAANVVAPESAVFGEEIGVEWTGENIGTLEVGGLWSDLVFLSTDEQLSTDDRYLGALPIDVSPYAPEDPVYDGMLAVTLPLDTQTATGDYYVLVKVDGNNAIDELDEGNNVALFGPVYVELPPLPNLQIINIKEPATVEVGESAHVEWDVTNTGGEPTDGSFLVTLYVSADGQVGGDTPLANVPFEGILDAGESASMSADVVISDLGTGQVHFVICADTVQDILEAGESDNCSVSAASPYDRPDLAVAGVIAPENAVAEDSVQITWTVENLGDAAAMPYWIDAVYLSSDAAFGNDILLSTKSHVTALESGMGYAGEVTVYIPSDAAGEYYFIIEADRGNRVRETGDPANNILVAGLPTTIVQPDRPNLVVSDIATPLSGVGGQEITVEWTVTNIGAAPAGGFWIDRVLASSDHELSPDDIELGTAQNVAPLDPAGHYTQQVTFEYPTVPDDYYIFVITDAMNAVNEGVDGGENDNTSVSDATFAVVSFTATAEADIEDAPAGTPVTITGQAIVDGTSDPAVDVPVVVRIVIRGFERRITQRTDTNGEFEVVYRPGPTEGGLYSVSAGPGHVAGLPVSDQFRLWSMLTQPQYAQWTVRPGVPQSGQFNLKNAGDQTLTGVAASVSGAPVGVDVQVTLFSPNNLGGLETKPVGLTITADADVEITGPIYINLTADHGATAQFAVLLTVSPAVPTLAVVQADLVGGKAITDMVRGKRSYVQFRVRNVGGATTSPLNVQLPAISWMSLATPTPLAPVAPGAYAAVVVRLDPPEDLPLGPYTGTIAVHGDNTAVGVPFRFVNTSVGLGDLLVRATDEFTYYAAGAPQVAGGVGVAP